LVCLSKNNKLDIAYQKKAENYDGNTQLGTLSVALRQCRSSGDKNHRAEGSIRQKF